MLDLRRHLDLPLQYLPLGERLVGPGDTVKLMYTQHLVSAEEVDFLERERNREREEGQKMGQASFLIPHEK